MLCYLRVTRKQQSILLLLVDTHTVCRYHGCNSPTPHSTPTKAAHWHAAASHCTGALPACMRLSSPCAALGRWSSWFDTVSMCIKMCVVWCAKACSRRRTLPTTLACRRTLHVWTCTCTQTAISTLNPRPTSKSRTLATSRHSCTPTAHSCSHTHGIHAPCTVTTRGSCLYLTARRVLCWQLSALR